MKLTPKQKAFCDEYLIDLNATQAYIRAGYAVKDENVAAINSSRLLSYAKIQGYLKERMENKDNNRIASQDEVLEYLTRVLRGEEKEENIVTLQDKEYEGKNMTVAERIETVYTEPKIRDRNKAAELLGRRYSLFSDKVSITGEVGVKIIDNVPEPEE